MGASALIIGEPLPALRGYEQVVAEDADAALKLVASRRFDAMVVRYRMSGGDSLALLRDCMRAAPDMRRILLAEYADLPEIVGARARGLVARVIPQSATPEKIARVIDKAIAGNDEASNSRSVVHGAGWEKIEELIRATAMRLAQVRGAVVRPLGPDPLALQLQFVLRGNKRIEALRADLVRRWLWPIKSRAAAVDRKLRKHPVLARFGHLSEESEVYAQYAEDENLYAYVVLLPWSQEPRITAVLGILSEQPRSEQWELLVDAHAKALEELSEFAMPDAAPEEDVRAGALAVPEYDWVVTSSYAGPERRRRPTSFLNRFILFGRRVYVPERLTRASDLFADRPTTRIWPWFAAYGVLALVDTALTWKFVREGLVQEANPLLRPLVLHHPWGYLAVKNGLALVAFFVVSRFQLFRFGTWFLRVAVGLWALLDLYWAALLWHQLH